MSVTDKYCKKPQNGDHWCSQWLLYAFKVLLLLFAKEKHGIIKLGKCHHFKTRFFREPAWDK